MRDRILEIVVFLMDYMRDSRDPGPETEDFSSTLKHMGYSENEISSAYFWLMNRFDDTPEQLFAEFPDHYHANRILTTSERVRLTTEAHGFLVKLLNLSLIDSEQMENILERIAVFGADPVNVEQVKIIASTVVFREFDDFGTLDLEDPDSSRSILIN